LESGEQGDEDREEDGGTIRTGIRSETRMGETPNIQQPTYNFERITKNEERRTKNEEPRTSNVQHPTPNVTVRNGNPQLARLHVTP
jgi:hypothetical protein